MNAREKEARSAWDGNWEERVYQRIGELGYASYLDYLEARRGHSYEDLATELSRGKDADPIAPVQLENLHTRTVSPADKQDAILDSLARSLCGKLRKGWGLGKYWEIDAITALTFWCVNWGKSPDLYALEREIRELNPEPGWRPKDSNDPILKEAARRVWSTG